MSREDWRALCQPLGAVDTAESVLAASVFASLVALVLLRRREPEGAERGDASP